MADERHDAAFIVGAVLGGLAGGAYALLNAPQSGARTRAELGERWGVVGERMAAGVAQIDAKTRPARVRIGGAANATVERFGRLRRTTDRAGGAEVAEGDPLITLPDPLEPDPIADDVNGAGPERTPPGADMTVDVPRVVGPSSG